MINVAVQVSGSAPNIEVRPLVAAAAQAVAVEVKRNFLEREARPNRMNWPKQHFWKREGFDKTTAQVVADDAAVVQVASKQIAHKLLGGTIRPGPGKKALAIPVTAEAYAAGSPRLGVIAGLFHPKGTNYLATKGEGTSLELQYMLVKQVTQAPDPETLPKVETLEKAAGAAAGAALARQLSEGAKEA